MGRLAVITRKREREKTQKNVAPEGIHGLGSGNRFSRSSFLRRKVASFCLETPIFKKMFRAQQRFQGVGESRLVFKGVAQTIFVAGSGIERKTTLDVNLH